MSKKRRAPYEYEMFASDRGWHHGDTCRIMRRPKNPKKMAQVILRASDLNDVLARRRPFTDENVRKAFRSGFVRAAGFTY